MPDTSTTSKTNAIASCCGACDCGTCSCACQKDACQCRERNCQCGCRKPAAKR